MLDDAIVSQLRQHFEALKSEFQFAVARSSHAKQDELVELLNDLEKCSPNIKVKMQEEQVSAVQFDIVKSGIPTGIRFRGVPGGHEFTSLVLAILNADGLGKLPDMALQSRVKQLQGPIELKTYVSLSCTNCPDVVQALNLMALLNDNITHEMLDGGLFEEEIEEAGVQSVPTVCSSDSIIHVGRGSFGELLDELEERFGSETIATGDSENSAPPKIYDVVVVGGGPAGASAAIYSARKGLKTAVVAQRFGGQVKDTVGIENLISIPYTEGTRLAADLEKHLREYPIDLLEHRKVDEIRNGARKELYVKGGERIEASALILATGARWRELGVPGEKEYLGRGVAFCPHCDGPFYKGKRVAVVGGGNSGIEAAIDLAGICAHVTVVEYLDVLKADDVLVRNLKVLTNVDIITGARVTGVAGNENGVTALNYQDRKSEEMREVAIDGVFVQIGLVPNSAIARDLVELSPGGEIVIDSRCRTNVPGIYAAGDVTNVPFKQIVVAMGEGAKAALSAFEDRIRAEQPV